MKYLKKTEDKIVKSIEQLEEDAVLKLANDALEAGMEPLYLLKLMAEGMTRVGKLYESRDYFIADLIMAGLIYKDVLRLDHMTRHFHSNPEGTIGKIMIGTVKGDIHDIGKDILRGMLEVNGFEVIDLGVDVPKELFIQKYEEHKPDIIGLSGILTNSIDSMKEVIEAFIGTGRRNEVKLIVGGNHLTEGACNFIGADCFAKDVSDGVEICKKWISGSNRKGERND
ncbi:MAG: cobalamin-dependent protein [Desulfosporosinus sp.]|nr:cobalamin-dependent protein [Desulfosporosinus sp.]